MSKTRFLRRIVAVWRINWGRIALGLGALLLAAYLLTIANAQSPGSPDQTFLHVIVGALLTAAGSTLYSLMTHAQAYREGSYTERAKAVQSALALARSAKAACLSTAQWARHELPPPVTTPNFGESCVVLLQEAWHQRVWIGDRGEEAVRAYISELRAVVDAASGKSDEALNGEISARFVTLEEALMSDLGFWPH